MMENLPHEILSAIINYAQHDLASLALTCRTLNTVSTPKLYENVIISSKKFLPKVDVLQGAAEGLARAKTIKDLHAVRELCIATKGTPEESEQTNCFHPIKTQASLCSVEGLEKGFMSISRGIPDGCLESFSWMSRCCVPIPILGPGGYLPQHQRNLTKLALVTSGECGVELQGENPLDLSQFTKLLEFSWIGPYSVEEFSALRECLKNNADHLQHLNIDLVNWMKAEIHRSHRLRTAMLAGFRRNTFADEVLEWSASTSSTPGVTLSALQNLSLSGISFLRGERLLAESLNFERLKCLKLNDCRGVTELLEWIFNAHVVMRLTQFEITAMEYSRLSDRLKRALENFLKSFHGLESLSLCIPDAMWEGVAPGLQNHISSLKSFVLHTTKLVDQRTQGAADADLDWFGWSILRLMWADSQWDFFGTSSPPGELSKTLGMVPKKPTWTVLHLRRSGCTTAKAHLREKLHAEQSEFRDLKRRLYAEDMVEASELAKGKSRAVRVDEVELRFELLDFVIWAFGKEGLPNLQVIAYGDFSGQGRYAEYSSMFRRDRAQLFCEVRMSDAAALELIDEHKEALESCPTTSILK